VKETVAVLESYAVAVPIVGAFGTVGERVLIAAEVADGIDDPTELVAIIRNL
jgi:hypothetical protein